MRCTAKSTRSRHSLQSLAFSVKLFLLSGSWRFRDTSVWLDVMSTRNGGGRAPFALALGSMPQKGR